MFPYDLNIPKVKYGLLIIVQIKVINQIYYLGNVVLVHFGEAAGSLSEASYDRLQTKNSTRK
jgi:hypothetical protein